MSTRRDVNGATFGRSLAWQRSLTRGERVQSQHSGPPAWVAEIDRAYSEASESFDLPYPDDLCDRPEAGFLELIRPLLGLYVRRLRRGIQAQALSMDAPPFEAQSVDRILFERLPGRLLPLMLRTLALELHVARLRGLLEGEGPQERFRSYVDRLCRRQVAIEIFNEYPVLARLIVTCLENWLTSSLEFLERWRTDWPAICEVLSPADDPGPLVGIEGDAGDTHRGGRAVLIARCRSGFRVVYKPRSLAVDGHFQELLGWLNAKGFSAPFRQLRIVDRGSHGWEEFVAPEGCSRGDAVARFYLREGGLLGILYALAASDCHLENVIAAGEHPVLIDLEALFHPSDRPSAAFASHRTIEGALEESVLGTGLLPIRSWTDRNSGGFDLSGMGAEPGKELPWLNPSWMGMGTDALRLVRRADVIELSDHRPTLNGEAVTPFDYAREIESGFRAVYDLLERNRAELLAPGGPLERFAEDDVRVVLRPTSRYAELLQEGAHPDVLRDALDRDRLFDRLRDEAPTHTHLPALIPSEVEDLWRGDIPFFTTHPRSRDLCDSSGRRRTDLFTESGLDRVRRRVERLGADDFDSQRWLLRASLTTLHAGSTGATRSPSGLVEGAPAADRERLIAASCAVADRLAETALQGNGDVNWIGLTPVREEKWSLLPLGVDLYDGLPGVALFLGYLGAVTGHQRYTALAHRAVATLRLAIQTDRRHKSVRSIGAFTGWGGILYSVAHLGALWGEPELLDEAHSLVGVLPDLIAQDDDLDLMSGAAGCIAGLLCLHACRPSQDVLSAAVLCGEHLIERGRPMKSGLAWSSSAPAREPLTGLSHGAAGISWTLIELASRTGDNRFRQAALGGIAYERSLFSAEAGNWPDLRILTNARPLADDASPPFATTWCHGAPGIGLARLRCLARLDDPQVRSEIDVALMTTVADGFGFGHCLCHGDFGNLELLLCGALAHPESRWRSELDRLTASIVNGIDRDGWNCGNPLGVETPGLMTGIAGIGYALLRLAEPGQVPSVLTLAPPPASSTESALRLPRPRLPLVRPWPR